MRRSASAVTAGPLSTVISITAALDVGRLVAERSATAAAPLGVVGRGKGQRQHRRAHLAFSSAEVPWAMILPWSKTTSCLARRSASSRYWVVSSTVVPPSTRRSMIAHRS